MSDAVINFMKKRSEAIEEKRREFERIMFRNFLGCYSVIDDEGTIYSIEMVDISDRGCLFQVPTTEENGQIFQKNKDIALRMYFTKASYLPISVTIKHVNEFNGDDGIPYMRYGCEFDKTHGSFEALEHFIAFIYKYAEHCSPDRGDSKIYTPG